MNESAHIDNKPPPQDIEAEQAVLGACLIEPSAAERAFAIVEQQDFYPEVHRLIFGAIQAVHRRGEPVDLVTVSAELRRLDQLEDCGGGDYLTKGLIGKVPTAAHVVRYAGIVAEKSVLRQSARLGEDLTKAAYDNPADVAALLDEYQARFQQDIYRRRQAAADSAISDIDAQDLPTILGGTTWLHKPLLARGYLTMLVGTSFVGKSITAYRLALSVIGELPWPGTDVTVDEPGVVCWAECESGQQSIVDRIEQWELTRPGIRIAGVEGERRFSIPADLDEIRAWLVQREATLFIADSFRTFFGGNENSSGEVTNALLPLAEMLRDLNIPGLLLHHSRKVQELESHVFELEKSRGSSAIYAVPRIIAAMDLPDRETETRRLFIVQSNIGPAGDAWGVDIDPETGLPTFTDEVPQEPREKLTTRTCKDFLTDLLAFGPVKAADVLTQGAEQGFRQSAAYAAAAKLPVYRRKVTNRQGAECTWWSLTPFPEEQLFTDGEES